jgi:tryptophan 2,3-dioxygenase
MRQDEATKPVTYWDYIKLNDLLGLQSGLGHTDHDIHEDELHFIVVHQVFELWFKLILRELRLAIKKLDKEHVDEKDIPFVVHHLRRVKAVLAAAVGHFDVLETLLPQEFLQFRDKLGNASGAHSFQFREIEYTLGLTDAERSKHGNTFDPISQIRHFVQFSEPHIREHIERTLNEAQRSLSLRRAMHRWLSRTPINGSMPKTFGVEVDRTIVTSFRNEYAATLLSREPNRRADWDNFFPPAASSDSLRIHTAILFIESYHELPLLAWPRLLLEAVVDIEELLILWRVRHARVVERMLGGRPGTAGSEGVGYLDKTINYRIFPELFAVRSILLPTGASRTRPDPKLYEFYIDSESAGFSGTEELRTSQKQQRPLRADELMQLASLCNKLVVQLGECGDKPFAAVMAPFIEQQSQIAAATSRRGDGLSKKVKSTKRTGSRPR